MSLFVEQSVTLFLILTVVIGGGAAWLAGRALANNWRPYWKLILFMLPLGGAVRFFHYALFGGDLLSVHYYLTDTLVLIVMATLGFRQTRAKQMVTQYRWLYRRTSPFTWTRRDTEEREPAE